MMILTKMEQRFTSLTAIPMEFVPAELRHLSVLIGQSESSESPGSIPRKHCTTCELNPKKPTVFFEMLVPKGGHFDPLLTPKLKMLQQ